MTICKEKSTPIGQDVSPISMEPMKNLSSSNQIKTYQTLIDRLKRSGIQPKYHVLNNKTSAE